MAIVRQSSWKKLGMVLLVMTAMYAGLWILKNLVGWLVVRRLMRPEVYSFSNLSGMRAEERERFEKFLRVKIPESARDIYYFRSGGKDKANLCSFILRTEESNKFAEEFIGVPLSRFRNFEDYYGKISGLVLVLEGPTIWGEKYKTPSWNISDIYQRCLYFETDRKPYTRAKFMIVDPETNRVYVGL